MSSLNIGGAISKGTDQPARMSVNHRVRVPPSLARLRWMASHERQINTMPPNPQASSKKSIKSLAWALPTPWPGAGTPEDHAPDTLKANGDPGREAARPSRVAPSNPVVAARPNRDHI